nr:translation initiation factor IF-2-like [Symphalangus syndactylus]
MAATAAAAAALASRGRSPRSGRGRSPRRGAAPPRVPGLEPSPAARASGPAPRPPPPPPGRTRTGKEGYPRAGGWVEARGLDPSTPDAPSAVQAARRAGQMGPWDGDASPTESVPAVIRRMSPPCPVSHCGTRPASNPGLWCLLALALGVLKPSGERDGPPIPLLSSAPGDRASSRNPIKATSTYTATPLVRTPVAPRALPSLGPHLAILSEFTGPAPAHERTILNSLVTRGIRNCSLDAKSSPSAITGSRHLRQPSKCSAPQPAVCPALSQLPKDDVCPHLNYHLRSTAHCGVTPGHTGGGLPQSSSVRGAGMSY